MAYRLTTRTLGVAAVGLIASQIAWSQDVVLQEIVVTAEKRVSTQQQTPIAMTVASGDKLTENGVTDINGITNVAPTVLIAQNNANTLVTIRGVTSQNFTETGDPAVAISIDNFYLQRAFSVNAALFDIDRVEVLRGPQGTLYGRNATAGAINFESRKPGDEFEFKGSAAVGDYSAFGIDAAVNLPITDTAAVRVAGVYRTRDGYRDNSPVSDGDDEDVKGGRIHGLWKPNSRFSWLLTGEFVRIGGVGPVLKNIPTGDVKSNGTLMIGSTSKWELNNPGYTNIDTDAIRTAISFDFDAATLSYFGGYQSSSLHRDNDQDGGIRANFGFQQNEELDDQNHELRLSSNTDSALSWQLGGYFFKQDNDLLTFFQIHGADPDPIDFFIFDYVVKNESKAAFAQIGYGFTDTVEVEAGIRYTEDEKSQVGFNDLGGAYSDIDNRMTDDEVTWHLGLNWQATPDNFVYAKIDKGYKAGGFTSTSVYGPEQIFAYEIGAKNRTANDTLEVNVSAFYYDYEDIQVNQIDPDNAQQLTLNAGKARVMGAELETRWLPTAATRVDFNLAWVDTEYTDFCTVTTSPCPPEFDLSGNELTQAPELTVAAGIEHDFLVFGGRLTPRIQTRYQSDYYFTITNDRAESQDSYTKSDILLTYEPDHGKWSASVYCHNLEDSTILTSAGFAGYADGYLLQFAPPRTYGARVNFRF